MGLSYALRKATEADWEFWRTLHHVAERATIERQFGTWHEMQQDIFARVAFDDPEGERQLVLLDGRRVGWWHVAEKDGDLCVVNLVIHPDFQKKGLGKTLMQTLLEQADMTGRAVRLQTLFENTARGWYEKLGFAVIGQTDTHWVMRRVAL